MDYLQWNDRIGKYFFKKERSGHEFCLSVTKEIIEEIGRQSNCGLNDFLNALRKGPSWSNRSGICQMALDCLRLKQVPKPQYPAYVAYLALFVLAAEGSEQDFLDPRAYYPRLRALMGEEQVSQQYPSFDRMIDLWKDLERWLNETQQGHFGCFHLQRNQDENWKHVSIPISQALLTEREWRAITNVLKSQSSYYRVLTEESIRQILLVNCAKELRPRTIRFLKSSQLQEMEMAKILFQRLRDFRNGLPDVIIDAEKTLPTQGDFQLRLCLQIDEIAERASFGIRCNLGEDFPEDDVIIQIEGTDERLVCYESGIGWSSLFALNSIPEAVVSATAFDWIQGQTFTAQEGGWELQLWPSKIRLFVSGKAEGLSDFVEIFQLPVDEMFYLMLHSSYMDWFEERSRSNCAEFKCLTGFNGVPSEWELLYLEDGTNYEFLYEKMPRLVSLASTGLKFHGGIRVGKGNDFFSFAPPKVGFSGGDVATELFCNNVLLGKDSSDSFYVLPEDVSVGETLKIEVRRCSEVIQTKNFFLKVDFSLQAPDVKFDNMGKAIPTLEAQEIAFINGALARVESLPDMPCTFPIPKSQESLFYLIGQEVGQIVKLPHEQLPTTWSPIWMIKTGSSLGQAIFCGCDIAESYLIHEMHYDEHNLREWREILWHQRKRILPPPQPAMRKLWRKFQAEVSHVR